MSTHLYLDMYMQLHINRLHTHTHTHTHTLTHICMHMHMHTATHAHTHNRTATHPHMHMHMHAHTESTGTYIYRRIGIISTGAYCRNWQPERVLIFVGCLYFFMIYNIVASSSPIIHVHVYLCSSLEPSRPNFFRLQ